MRETVISMDVGKNAAKLEIVLDLDLDWLKFQSTQWDRKMVS